MQLANNCAILDQLGQTLCPSSLQKEQCLANHCACDSTYRLADNVHISTRLEPVLLPPLQCLPLQSDGAAGAGQAGGQRDGGGLLLEETKIVCILPMTIMK